MSDPPVRISASQVSLILQRAAEIDSREDSLTVEELRRIAAEAGIDPLATDTAIQELMGQEEPAPLSVATTEPPAAPVAMTKSPSPGRIVTGSAVGVALGFLLSLPAATEPLAFGGAIMYVLLRAVQSMKRGAQLDFQLQNFAVWFGTLVAGSATRFFHDLEIFPLAFTLWILTSFVGGLLVRFGPREEEDSDDPSRRIGPGSG